MMALDAEVIVAGGGPAGAATATLLARHGHDVLLLDRAAFPREKPCAEYLSPGVLDVLRRLGALERIASLAVARPWGMVIHTPRARLAVTYPASDITRPMRHALGVPRPAFDAMLLDHARAAGVRVRERALVTGAVVEGGQVVGVQTRPPSTDAAGAAGREPKATTLRARVVVAADGLHSAVARSLGLERPMRWPRRLGLVARYTGVTGLEDHGAMYVGRRRYGGLAPVGDGLVNVGLVGPLDEKRPGESREALFARWLAALPGAASALVGARRVTPVRGTGPLARRVRQVAGPGYLLVGDAAGFLDPFTGEGVYRALRGAELAAAAVERMLRRADALPVGYAAARRAAFAEKERVTWLIQGFMAAPPAFDAALHNLARRPTLAATLGGILGDYQPAAAALRPAFLAALLRP